MKTKLINTLLHRYNNILKEIISQKKLFVSEQEYLNLLTKVQGYINTIQTIQLRALCTATK